MREPAICVVVVTRGPSLALARLLRSLGRAREIERAQVLVGLNGNGSVRAAERLGHRFLPAGGAACVRLPRSSPAEARNGLARRATAPLLLFLDDDVEVPPGLLVAAREVMSDPALVAAGGPNLTPPASSRFEELAGRVLGSPLGTGPVSGRYRLAGPRPASERTLALCNLAIRRSAFREVEFDGDLACAEENELLERLAGAGGTIAYRPELAVFHHRRRTLRSHLAQMGKYGAGRGQLLVRAPTLRQLPYALPSLLLLGLAPAATLGPPLPVAAAVAAYLVALAAAAVRVGGLRRAPLALALLLGTHLAYAAGVVAGSADELLVKPARARSRARRESRLAGDATKTFLALVVAVGLGVASGIVIARLLGPEGRGLWELARTLAFAVGLPAGLGLGGRRCSCGGGRRSRAGISSAPRSHPSRAGPSREPASPPCSSAREPGTDSVRARSRSPAPRFR